MSIIFYLKLYFSTLLVFLGIDYIWLTKISTNFYKSGIGHLMSEKPNLTAAGITYLLHVIGTIIFAINPALKAQSPKLALIYGALYGFFTYVTYDLTNLATLKNWPIKIVYVDVLWGVFLTGVTALAGYYIGSKIS